jgi:hypothetical protein
LSLVFPDFRFLWYIIIYLQFLFSFDVLIHLGYGWYLCP